MRQNLAEKMAATVSDLRAKGQVREKIEQGNTETLSEKGTCSYGRELKIVMKSETSSETATPEGAMFRLRTMRRCYSGKKWKRCSRHRTEPIKSPSWETV